jgi:hypothetical protein
MNFGVMYFVTLLCNDIVIKFLLFFKACTKHDVYNLFRNLFRTSDNAVARVVNLSVESSRLHKRSTRVSIIQLLEACL